uniref:DUF6377 domain-containing protein n=2 Tax=uncultured Muribaculum sp. TaxID=1918613 RepID=UPI002631DFC9
MQHNRIKIILLVIALFAGTARASDIPIIVSSENIENVLEQLDEVLENRNVYITSRLNRIDSIKSLPVGIGREAYRMLEIGKEYESFNNDSALVYFRKGYELARSVDDMPLRLELRLLVIKSTIRNGFVKEGYDMFLSIPEDSIDYSMRTMYYGNAKEIFYQIGMVYYTATPPYNDLCNNYNHKYMKYIIPGSINWEMSEAEIFIYNCNYGAAVATAIEIMEKATDYSPEYARAAFLAHYCYEQQGNKLREQLYFMAQTAISEVMGGCREGLALHSMGQLLYDYGDINRAHRYLSAAIDISSLSAANLRAAPAVESLVLMERSFKDRGDYNATLIWLLVLTLVIWLLIIVGALIYYRRDMARLRKAHARIAQANNAKETYLKNFLDMCALSTKRLGNLCKTVNRKLASGQVEDLYGITRSGRIMDEQRKEFYMIFDHAFLHIYPSFFEELNSLLREEERYVAPTDGKLPTELRIYALVRLGVDDGSRIAEFLGYSINTVYAYRAKVKAK